MLGELSPEFVTRLHIASGLALLVATAHAAPHVLTGRVVGITDGDTITLMDAAKRQHKIRLDGIDTPGSGHPFGGASKRNLSDLAFNQESVAECSEADRYGREVCHVVVVGADV